MASVTIEKTYDEGTWRWQFTLSDTLGRIFLTNYAKLTPPLKGKRIWHTETLYDLYARQGTPQMDAIDVPLPADVIREAKEKMMDLFKITRTPRGAE